jgi:hypothetical protein
MLITDQSAYLWALDNVRHFGRQRAYDMAMRARLECGYCGHLVACGCEDTRDWWDKVLEHLPNVA